MRKSPTEYKSKLSVIRKPDYFTYPVKAVAIRVKSIIIDDNKDEFSTKLKFGNLVIKNDDKVIPGDINKFKSFLCELESFNWTSNTKHFDNISYFLTTGNSSIYFKYLCKMFGNDITLFTAIYTNYHHYWEGHKGDSIMNRTRPYFIPENDPFFSVRKNAGLEYEYINSPIMFLENDDGGMTCYYTDEIKRNPGNTHYSLIQSEIITIEGGSHYVFFFVDYKKKIVQYYDSHGSSIANEGKLSNFIYSSISAIFPGFLINAFWEHLGLQNYETFDYPLTEEGFCVVWGNMIAHLKILNPDMSFKFLELMLIKECSEKNISLYEVMLNYAYYMKRIIVEDYNKFVKLENIVDSIND
jgi:hypothetical protein